jgi:hypothetical protein
MDLYVLVLIPNSMQTNACSRKRFNPGSPPVDTVDTFPSRLFQKLYGLRKA